MRGAQLRLLPGGGEMQCKSVQCIKKTPFTLNAKYAMQT